MRSRFHERGRDQTSVIPLNDLVKIVSHEHARQRPDYLPGVLEDLKRVLELGLQLRPFTASCPTATSLLLLPCDGGLGQVVEEVCGLEEFEVGMT